jgi:hypothetical protein
MHPGNGSVAVCHSCGRPLCITCAVPVRGEVFGSECLPEVLGPDTQAPRAVPARARNRAFDLVGVGFAVAAAASVVPWTRFGIASGMFGAWGILRLRWSSLAAFAALAGLLLWIGLRVKDRIDTPGGIALFVLAAGSITGSILHVLNPPPFTHAWLGPWAAIPAAGLAACAAVWTIVRPSRANTPDIP